PDSQTVGDSRHFAIARTRTERRGVQIGCDDLLARIEGIRSVHIGARRRRRHLQQLVEYAFGAALGLVLVFFDLGRQRAAATRLMMTQQRGYLAAGGVQETLPFDSRILVGVI